MHAVIEPVFLEQRRQCAAALTSSLSLPAKTDEAWRRTALEGLELTRFTPAAPQIRLKGEVPAGVIFTDLLTAATTYPDLVGKYLGSLFAMDQNLLTASHAAHLNGGIFLYVPKHVEIAEPLLVEYDGLPGKAHYTHTLVVAEANSSVTILEQYQGEGEYVHVGVVEALPFDGARVRVGYLQNHSSDAWAFLFRRGKTGRDTSLDWVGGEFGGSLTRSELVTDVSGMGSNSHIKVVYGASDTQHIDIVATQVHTGDNSSSDILGRGVLHGRSHTVFRGNGQIARTARNCSTYQRQQAILLSTKARADSIPALIIDENEVAGAGHAATVGRLDEEQLFYLMARGLTRQQAVAMLVLAFLSPVLDQIPLPAWRTEMTRLMGEKVTG